MVMTVKFMKRNFNVTKRMLQQVERNKRMQEMLEAVRKNNYEIAKKLKKFGYIKKVVSLRNISVISNKFSNLIVI